MVADRYLYAHPLINVESVSSSDTALFVAADCTSSGGVYPDMGPGRSPERVSHRPQETQGCTYNLMLENKPLGVELYRHAPGDDSRGGMRKRIQRFCFLRECFRLQRFWLWLWAQMGVTRRAWTRTANTSTSPVRTPLYFHTSVFHVAFQRLTPVAV